MVEGEWKETRSIESLDTDVDAGRSSYKSLVLGEKHSDASVDLANCE